jgi:hypothetical protein
MGRYDHQWHDRQEGRQVMRIGIWRSYDLGCHDGAQVYALGLVAATGARSERR